MDEKGKVVSHQVKDYVLTQKNLNDHPLVAAFRKSGKPTWQGFDSPEGNPSRGYIRGNEQGWALAVVQQDVEVFADLKQIRRLAMMFMGGTVVLVVLIAWLSARAVVTPIMTLTDVADRMSMGELDATFAITSRDEIGLLAQALTRMQISLKLALERLRRSP